ncbi:sodium/proline symporter PutP [methanogenic archaeon mixed culture ISO4-G1]|nr:sodium/proline symporter PutP [methanogenic archaeon mixed culture ISO4-G1]
MDFMVLLAFIVYFLIVLAIGYYFYRRSENMEDYILGGRNMNPYVTAMSAQASDMSGWLLMGLPGSVVAFGLGEAWIGIGLALGSYLSWLFVAKKLRHHSVVAGNALTMPEFFSNRYGDKKGYLRMIAAVIILFFFVIYVASGFKTSGIILHTIFPDISIPIAMSVGAIIIIAYTFMGGFKAVCWTDFFQAILMVIAVVVVPLVVIGNLGGMEHVTELWDATGVEEFANLFYDGGQPLSAIAIISLMAWALGYFGMPHIVVRYMSIRHPKEVKIARRVSLIWIILALSAAILIGMVGRAYLQELYGGIPADFNTEEIFIVMVGDLFYPLIAGILFAAVMAASMSTADSQLLVSSSSITNDVLKGSKWAEKQENADYKLMWISRAIVIVISIVALILAAFGSDSIMGLVSYAWAGFGAAFGPLMILSLYWKRMNFYGAMASMVVGFVSIILWNTFLAGPTGIYELLPGFILSLIAGVIVSLVTAEPSEEIKKQFDDAQVFEEE